MLTWVELMSVAFVLFPFPDKAFPGAFIFAFRSKENLFELQIGENGQVLMAFANTDLVYTHASGLAHVFFGVGGIHMRENHSPQS